MSKKPVVTQVKVQGNMNPPPIPVGDKEWSSGLFGCFDDVRSMLCVMFCPPCYTGKLSQRMGEHCCVPLCVPGGGMLIRAKMRYILGIKGTFCNECLLGACCGLCMWCQMAREMDRQGW